MPFTCTPAAAHSSASTFVSCSTPPFEEAYAAWLGRATLPRMLDTLMTLPDPRATKCPPAARAPLKQPFRFVATTNSNSSGVSSRAGLRTFTPALLTRMSRRPSRSTAAPAMASQSSGEVTSAVKGAARRPRARISSARRSSSAAVRLASSTSAPAAASASAIVRPSPRPAPVTMATRPLRSNSPVPSSSGRSVGALIRSAGPRPRPRPRPRARGTRS